VQTVSVIIPVLNGSAFIRDAIASVATQTHSILELIVVDDGSTDDSVQVAQSAIGESGINGRVVQRPNNSRSGAGSCRNFGASLASGEFIAFLDADDIWKPTHISNAMAAFASNDDSMGVYSSMCETIAENGGVPGRMPEAGFPALGLQDALPFLLKGMFVPTVTLCIRKFEFQRTEGFSESLSCYEDWWLVLQLAAQTRFFFEAETGCAIRIGGGSLTRAPAAKGRRLAMSDAMYTDQLRLFALAKRAEFLGESQLSALRTSVIEWNARQLNDLISSGQFGESMRILRALNRAKVIDLIRPICVRALAGVGKRATAKLVRMGFSAD
jgi:hypothetical protein